MKVIDLLNKIAKEEKVPKKIEYDKKTYHYVEMWQQYVDGDDIPLFRHISTFNYSGLNDEVEIIEEQEEIDIQNIEELSCYEECTTRGDIIEKINELIQAIKQIDKKIKEM